MVKGAGGGAVTALAFSPDGHLLALGTAEGEAGIVLFPEGLLRRVEERPRVRSAVATQEARSGGRPMTPPRTGFSAALARSPRR
ncbi:MAG: hypothetical protein JOY65_15790, partial [Acetobacteraceae bacterium]|nr:hypothetical protein [Acetobacteraceae bacterium]